MEMETVFSTLTDAVIVLDESGRVVKSNPASRAAYGFDPAGLDTNRIQKKISLSHLDGVRVPFEEWPVNKALLGHTIIKERLVLRDGEERVSFVAATACPLLSEGKLVGGVQVLHNVTEGKGLYPKDGKRRGAHAGAYQGIAFLLEDNDHRLAV